MASKPPITCHILDTTTGTPASGVVCSLFYTSVKDVGDTVEILSSEPFAMARTNEDGRVPGWVFDPDPKRREALRELGVVKDKSTLVWSELKQGVYKIRFQTGKYFSGKQKETFFPFVDVVFEVSDTRHYHIPLLLSNYSYSTYRGS
ncbi:LAMI_0H11892g1_1 [Lachancea mirantina]|uniref:5-hydroxyisourate hydrolase n=1 Tax=Lachancea mirantina TaxID=1230905 RepID=A0A1G4KHM1_9SACH|nr:LAMI_0H11892g1_1 [Lachancea mirantina]